MNNMMRMVNEDMLKRHGKKLGSILACMNVGTFILLQSTKDGPGWSHIASVLLVVAGILVLGTRPRY